jgi:hypothetical protein
MTRISHIDQVLVLLQEQLRKTGRRSRTTKRAASAARSAALPPLERARRLAALDALSDEERRHVLVEGLLSDAFGERLTSDPRFQSLAKDVTRIIGESDEGAHLLEQAIAELRASG